MSIKLLAYLTCGDTSTWDRWCWLKRRLPLTRNGEKLLDVGCGTGAYTIGAALRGYSSLGLSWDKANQDKAITRARDCGAAEDAQFEVLDVRHLDSRPDLKDSFEVAICCECAEHIIDDRKLFRDMSAGLKPGGRLLFTAPNYYYRAMSEGDLGPFCREETGWHVRRGYSPAMLEELCRQSGLACEELSYCTGYFSQKITGSMRNLRFLGHRTAWAVMFPLRVLTVCDSAIGRLFGYPGYSICMVAVKPRYREE